jgi:FkbH-like protein
MSTSDQVIILSDFNAEMLAGLMSNDLAHPRVDAKTGGFGQVTSVLVNPGHPAWQEMTVALVWTQPESISEVFVRAKMMESVDHSEAIREVDVFCDAIESASSRVQTMLVSTWCLPAESRGYGMLDFREHLGVRSLLSRMNQRLAERLGMHPGVFLLDSNPWLSTNGAYDPKMWYLAKVPYSKDVFKAAVKDVKAALRGVKGLAKKIVICDLDDTLWGGIVGEVGWENLRLGGHDPIGEALADFQKQLKALTRRGVILAIVSKNTESIALEAIENHPEMVLRKEDFAGWKINWTDKAQNIADLMKELNLGINSAVFLDDNPVERARVAEALPEVLVVDMPTDKLLYPATLKRLDCFDTPTLSDEDRKRAEMYQLERERRAAQQHAEGVGSMDDWLHSLLMQVEVEPLQDSNQQRIGQLLNKTNQMNLTTRRMTESELVEWASAPNCALWGFRVADKFGDAGLTGIASCEVDGGVAQIVDFVLSCRVMGRRVEETMVHHVVEFARRQGVEKVVARYQPTAKNSPCLKFWRQSGFEEHGNETFVWNCVNAYPQPDAIALSVQEAAVKIPSK